MIRAICQYLKEVIATKDYAEVVAGLAVPFEERDAKGKTITYPVDCGVLGADCTDGLYTALIPNSEKASLFYFEEVEAPKLIEVGTRLNRYQAIIRMVGWLNLDKLGLEPIANCQGCTHGTRIWNELLDLFPKGQNIGGDCKVVDLNVEMVRQMPTSFNPWQAYSVDNTSRNFLQLPHEAFGIELRCTWMVSPQCVERLTIGDPACGSETPIRRRYPKDFSCDELLNPTTGLTPEQVQCILDAQ